MLTLTVNAKNKVTPEAWLGFGQESRAPEGAQRPAAR
jgi:hypothetical protein